MLEICGLESFATVDATSETAFCMGIAIPEIIAQAPDPRAICNAACDLIIQEKWEALSSRGG